MRHGSRETLSLNAYSFINSALNATVFLLLFISVTPNVRRVLALRDSWAHNLPKEHFRMQVLTCRMLCPVWKINVEIFLARFGELWLLCRVCSTFAGDIFAYPIRTTPRGQRDNFTGPFTRFCSME